MKSLYRTATPVTAEEFRKMSVATGSKSALISIILVLEAVMAGLLAAGIRSNDLNRIEMAVILLIGYAGVVIHNLTRAPRPALRIDIRWLLVCGIGIQFAWEAALLLGGIRSAGLGFVDSLKPLVIDSLLETNLGMPYVYLIFLAVSARWHEDLTPRTPALSLACSLERSNARMRRAPFTVTAIRCGTDVDD